MESASKLLKNTLILAASTVLLRLFTLFFQSYLASSIGAEKLGLFGIISSVGVSVSPDFVCRCLAEHTSVKCRLVYGPAKCVKFAAKTEYSCFFVVHEINV